MPGPEPLQPDQYYHVYNRGINGEPPFRKERNYRHFLKLWAKYIEPIAETYAYCLLSNHFDFLVRIKETDTETGPISKIGPVCHPRSTLKPAYLLFREENGTIPGHETDHREAKAS